MQHAHATCSESPDIHETHNDVWHYTFTQHTHACTHALHACHVRSVTTSPGIRLRALHSPEVCSLCPDRYSLSARTSVPPLSRQETLKNYRSVSAAKQYAGCRASSRKSSRVQGSVRQARYGQAAEYFSTNPRIVKGPVTSLDPVTSQPAPPPAQRTGGDAWILG